jgi:hypothetical protein
MSQCSKAMLLMLLLLAAPAAGAHQEKETLTRVLFNPRTGNIEVMHRFLLHDVEHAVKELRNDKADILNSYEDREYFSSYVHQHFFLNDQQDRSLPLHPVGHEIDGRFLWVYAETGIPAHIQSLTLRYDFRRGIWPGQVNLVNIERNGVVKSAAFTGGSRELTVDLSDP